MLVIGATLLAQSLARLLSVDVGFPPDRLIVASLSPSPGKYPSPDHAGAFFRRVADEVRALPGVTSVSLASTSPFGSFLTGLEMGPTQPTAGLPQNMRADWRIVTSEYFRTLDIPVRRGRLFGDADPEALRPILLSESVVRRLWPDSVDPIGQRVWLGNGQVRTVIGIVGDVHQRTLDEGRTPTMYLPTTWTWWPTMTLIVRTAGEPSPVMTSLRDAARRVDPDQALFDVQTMSAQMRGTAAQPRLNAGLLGLFAALALALGAVGVAGVLADAVARRRAELALRMALGATGRRVVREVAARGLVLCAWGLALGLIGALWLGRALSGLLFGVTAHDPVVFGAVAVVLMGVAAIACWLPASRVARIDPATALRGD
jgi:putative ABC transport system permease protein